MNKIGDFELPKWAEHDHNGAATLLAAGSQGPGMTLDEVKDISSDPKGTAAALHFHNIKLVPSPATTLAVTKNLANFYPDSKIPIEPSHILLAHATTGVNSLVLQSLLHRGDHVICTFPSYNPLFQMSEAVGASLSLLHLDEKKGWAIDLSALESLISPRTRMLILNNPHNPTGSIIPTQTQEKIVALCAKHDLILFCDEIFRPLFHTADHPTSFLEHSTPAYDKIVVTGSLSKAWGFAGVRVGWVITTNSSFRTTMHQVTDWILQDVSEMDKILAAEILSERCSSRILAKNLGFTKKNLDTLRKFLSEHEGRVSCVVPKGGSTAFPRFLKKNGEPVDELKFAERLVEETGVLVSPGSLCFGPDEKGTLKGCVRMHMCIPPEKYRRVIEGIETFLKSEKLAKL